MKTIKNLLTIVNLINVLIQAIAYAQRYIASFSQPAQTTQELNSEGFEIPDPVVHFCYDGTADGTTRLVHILQDRLYARGSSVLAGFDGIRGWFVELADLKDMSLKSPYFLYEGTIVHIHPNHILITFPPGSEIVSRAISTIA